MLKVTKTLDLDLGDAEAVVIETGPNGTIKLTARKDYDEVTVLLNAEERAALKAEL